MSNIAGFDPGLNYGAVAILNHDTHHVVTLLDLPTLTDRKKKLLDARQIVNILKDYNVRFVAIEDVATRPGQGIVSSGNFMKAVGAIYGVAAALGIPFAWVPPAAWKRHFGQLGSQKDASRTRAIELFPGAQPYLTTKRGVVNKEQAIGRADALLIGAYCSAVKIPKVRGLLSTPEQGVIGGQV